MKIRFIPVFVFCYTSVHAQERVTDISRLHPTIIACTPVRDQSMSSTCWSFSSVSLWESELLKAGKPMTDLSEMFIARHSMIRKIRRHLQLRGANYFTPGGQFHDAVWVMKNFGLVPESAYPGKGRNETRHDHGELDTILSRATRYWVSNGITELDLRMETFIDSVLDRYLGKLPDRFEYRGKTYTALSFRDQYLGINPDDYLEITSYTHHPFYSTFVLEDKYNWSGDKYWNVPLEDFSRITREALVNGFTVGWDGDADDPGFHYYDGLAILPAANNPDRTKTRQLAFEDRTTLLDHMMHIVGWANDNQDTWYYIKNSWGERSNALGGYLYMREDYFLTRTVAIIVNKRAIPPDIRNKMGVR